MKRRLWKIAFLVETLPTGLRLYSKEFTNALRLYRSEIVLGSLYLEFVLFVANEAAERFEYYGLKWSKHPFAWYFHCKMMAVVIACSSL